MLKKSYGAGIRGTDGFCVTCEAAVDNGFPQFSFIGSLSGAAREAGDRVRTAISNTGIVLEPKHITINLSPSDIRKEGCAYDLPIAASLLAAYGLIPDDALDHTLFLGELSLSGKLLPVRGVLPMVMAAGEAGLSACFLPAENAAEGSLAEGISCYGIQSLSELIEILRGRQPYPPAASYREEALEVEAGPDFSDIRGQALVKRATLLAAAGRHNILYVGPAGTGKSLIAERLPSILPAMSYEERLSISRIYSVAGLLDPGKPLISSRPFRHPHHTVSPYALTGGGIYPKPGEVSLASGGILFLDELTEFRSGTLEMLRQPLEEREIRLSRSTGTACFPANFQLCCAMNPCRCGFYPDREKCRCSEGQVEAYLGKISGPFLDRIDIFAETPNISYAELKGEGNTVSSMELREQVERMRKIQEKRFSGTKLRFNSEMKEDALREFCSLNKEDEAFLKALYEKRNMSARALHRLLRVSRTAADADGSEQIRREHLAEAAGYRSPVEKYRAGGGLSIRPRGGYHGIFR